MKVKEMLGKKLGKKDLVLVKNSYDIVGDIVIVEIPEELKGKEKLITETILKVYPRIKAVLKKESSREGKERLRKFKVLFHKGGEGKVSETIHKEFDCRFKLDVEKVYFSPRESTERKRISDMVKEGETVLVMFAGVGPYGIVMAKHSKAGKVVCVEVNKEACRYMVDNIRINKMQEKIVSVCGDVGKLGEEYKGGFDRVVMPLPKEGYKFLPEAVKFLKERGFIHFYYVSHENELFHEAEEKIKDVCVKEGVKFRIVSKRKVLPYGPRVWKVCLDVEVRK
jgi:tRNA (guanine37-N1)-methyltransferase